ncbi:MAG: heme-binding protein [Betaproteobacteria bacterium]|nr:heme-binding protein [Betaproteobacteria bacterium]MDE2423795.1 heme-binding protein [Betaproteobacteria bacterium]
MATEEPTYKVLSSDNSFEVREYAPMIIAETMITGTMDEASSKGFRTIADFIFGNNHLPRSKESAKITMTAPVIVTPQSAKIAMTAPVTIIPSNDSDSFADRQSWSISFVMPQHYTMETIPQPNNSAVTLKVIPQRCFIAHRYSGFNGQSTIKSKIEETIQWSNSHHYRMIGKPQLARYNPPWTLPMFKRNEILIEIEKPN